MVASDKTTSLQALDDLSQFETSTLLNFPISEPYFCGILEFKRIGQAKFIHFNYCLLRQSNDKILDHPIS